MVNDHQAAAIVIGPVGSGKTCLAERLATAFLRDGMRVGVALDGHGRYNTPGLIPLERNPHDLWDHAVIAPQREVGAASSLRAEEDVVLIIDEPLQLCEDPTRQQAITEVAATTRRAGGLVLVASCSLDAALQCTPAPGVIVALGVDTKTLREVAALQGAEPPVAPLGLHEAAILWGERPDPRLARSFGAT